MAEILTAVMADALKRFQKVAENEGYNVEVELTRMEDRNG